MRHPNKSSLKSRRILRLRLVLVGLYVISNIFAAIMSLNTGELSADFNGFAAPQSSTIFVLLMGIVSAFLIVLFIMYSEFERRMGIKGKYTAVSAPKAQVSLAVMAMQLIHLAYSMYYGASIAGLVSKNESPLKYFYYIVSVDFLFLFYFASSTTTRFTTLNSLIFICSNVLRGWTSGFLYLGFLVLIKTCANRKFSLAKVCAFLIAGYAFLPLILYLKFYFRAIGGDIEITELAKVSNIESIDFEGITSLYTYSLFSLLDRLQHLSSLSALVGSLEELRVKIDSGFIRMFYFEGFPGFALYRLAGLADGYELNTALVSMLLNTDLLVSGYATHVGIIGWPIVAYESIPVYLLFLFFLMYLSFKLVKYSDRTDINELNWLMWLLLLMHGWFGAFISYVVAGYIYFYCVKRVG